MMCVVKRFYSGAGFWNLQSHEQIVQMLKHTRLAQHHVHVCARGERGSYLQWQTLQLHVGVWSAHWAELLQTSEIKIMENQHPGRSDVKTRPLCHRLRWFTPTASKSSERFLPGGWKTLLHLTGTSSTGIDLLSARIWDHMAHMPGGDAATRLNCLLSTTAWLRFKAPLQQEHGSCKGLKKEKNHK